MGQTKIPRHGCRSVRDGRGEGLGWCLNHGVAMRDLLQTVVDGLGPHERLGVLVIEPNELVDRRHHIHQRLHTPRVLRQLERFDPVRVQAVRVLDPCHAGSDFSGRQAVGTGLRSHPCLQRLRLCSRYRQRVGWFSPVPDDTRLTPYQKI